MRSTVPHRGASLAEATPPEPLFVSVRQAAQMLGLGTSKVWQMVYDGMMPTKRFGRAVRIPRQHLLDLAANPDRFYETW